MFQRNSLTRELFMLGFSPFMKLVDVGIRGNGHMMMLEMNNMEIAAVMSRWLTKSIPDARKEQTT